MDNWIGKAISINCGPNLGIFQGIIRSVTPVTITIVRAFRNGIPLKQQEKELSFAVTDIIHMELISDGKTNNYTVAEKTTNKIVNDAEYSRSVDLSILSRKLQNIKLMQSKESSAGSVENKQQENSGVNETVNYHRRNGAHDEHMMNNKGAISKAIDIPGNKSNVSTPYKIDKRKYRRELQNDQTFGTSVDDPNLGQDFDFEKNLALFDKAAIWNEINGTKPESYNQHNNYHQSASAGGANNHHNTGNKKYRHDENVITSQPTKYRQIKLLNKRPKQEYLTDMDLVIPTITKQQRDNIFKSAHVAGIDRSLMCDVIARSATEMAIQLIGGARRLLPTNQHQWPKIAIIIEHHNKLDHIAMGFCTARYLSSHALETFVFVQTELMKNELEQVEKPHDTQDTYKKNLIEMYMYDNNNKFYTTKVNELPSSDLVIIAAEQNSTFSKDTLLWINANRSPVLAIDPASCGIPGITIKCSIIPVLPLEDITSNCGMLYLLNLGLPEFIFSQNEMEYKSPFGHKSIIQIHKSTD